MSIHIKSGLRISDQGLVFDPSTGESFTLNPTGLILLRLMIGCNDENEIFRILNQDYELSRLEFDRYLLDFLAVLKSMQILENEA